MSYILPVEAEPAIQYTFLETDVPLTSGGTEHLPTWLVSEACCWEGLNGLVQIAGGQPLVLMSLCNKLLS